jgi:hypothetical protein
MMEMSIRIRLSPFQYFELKEEKKMRILLNLRYVIILGHKKFIFGSKLSRKIISIGFITIMIFPIK